MNIYTDHLVCERIDPSKHAKVTSSPEEDLSSSPHSHPSPPTPRHSHNNTLQKHTASHTAPHTNGPRHRGSLSMSDGQDGYSRSGSRSPERIMDLRGAAAAQNITSPHPSPRAGSSPPTQGTPLLMPPPTTRIGQIQQRGILVHYRAKQWLRANADSPGSFLRLAFLGVKLASLSWICWPYSFRSGILGSVFALAALDLWSPMGGRQAPNFPGGPRGGRSMVRSGPGGSSGRESSAVGVRRWSSGWWRSCTLLVLHFFVIWMTSHFGQLCAAGHPEKWRDW